MIRIEKKSVVFIVVFYFVVVLKTTCGTNITITNAFFECTNLTNSKNINLNMNLGFNYTKYFMQQSSISSDISEEWVDIAFRSSHGPDNTKCPKNLPRGDYPVMMRSTCPWYIKLNYDPERFPATIPHAVSRCQTCVGSEGSKKCEPIRRKINILRQAEDCGNGLYRYTQEEMNIVAAYVCTVPKEIESSFNNNVPTVFKPELPDDPSPIA